ncbi:peptide/nickel transport system ATP-binding protein [Friedmanniella luteola]|uniref:Peptide/nickel transport system ATP-binding protein n=1 Tax=Friedmanniella luteola TaxID=546871 RepID=A0A1H1WGE2_9ACTN|nr:ABC transporter ATP-binding protein [Friedmanniella luteola]SDS96347.1 peptide/nickel transport system ATP-binding protein [Friedmanniella luteola]
MTTTTTQTGRPLPEPVEGPSRTPGSGAGSGHPSRPEPVEGPSTTSGTGASPGGVVPLLALQGLHVAYRSRARTVAAVRGVDLTVGAGETVALVGESGSGKSTTAHALLGLLPPSARVSAGTASLDGDVLLTAGTRPPRGLLGRRVGFVPQDPMTALNPVQRVGDQVAEVLRVHGLADRAQAAERAVDALARAGLDRPADRARQYPHELSGGMRQRALIAIALVAEPSLLVADEPTSALDVTVQRVILDRIAELSAASGTGVLLITHDLGVAAQRADRIVVMKDGVVVEAGASGQLVAAPEHPYTRELLAAAPGLGSPVLAAPRPPGAPDRVPLLELRAVRKEYPLPRGGPRRVLAAVDGVDLTVGVAETVGLVGESGSGKSTTARLAARLVDPTGGGVVFDGEEISGARGERLRRLRRRFQLVYQNPYASLDPRLSVGESVAEPLRAFGVGARRDRSRRVGELLERVALPRTAAERRPAELSGGQRQRVAIARALALRPALVICDEPVSALDVSVQARILELLVGLQADLGLSYLFISHDLAVVRQIAHRIAVMRAGLVVETGPTEQIFTDPRSDYTRELLAAIPDPHPTRTPQLAAEGRP